MLPVTAEGPPGIHGWLTVGEALDRAEHAGTGVDDTSSPLRVLSVFLGAVNSLESSLQPCSLIRDSLGSSSDILSCSSSHSPSLRISLMEGPSCGVKCS